MDFSWLAPHRGGLSEYPKFPTPGLVFNLFSTVLRIVGTFGFVSVVFSLSTYDVAKGQSSGSLSVAHMLE